MFFSSKKVVLVLVVTVIILSVAFSAILFASSHDNRYDLDENGYISEDEAQRAAQAYFDEQIVRDEAIDYFLRYFAQVHVSSTLQSPIPTSVPTPTPTAAFIPTPTPTSCDKGGSGQLDSSNGYMYKGYYDKTITNPVRVAFTNPDLSAWAYGFLIEDYTEDETTTVFIVFKNDATLEATWNGDVIASEALPSWLNFDTDAGEENTIVLWEEWDEDAGTYQINIYVNGLHYLFVTPVADSRQDNNYFIVANGASDYRGLLQGYHLEYNCDTPYAPVP